jgi:hypothetical protein
MLLLLLLCVYSLYREIRIVLNLQARRGHVKSLASSSLVDLACDEFSLLESLRVAKHGEPSGPKKH